MVTGLCPECNSSKIISDSNRGEKICGNCGLVLSKNSYDRGPEWRSFTLEQVYNRERTGLNSLYSMFDKGLSTKISGYKDGKGKPLSPERLKNSLRLRKYNKQSKVSDTWRRNLSIAMSELSRMIERLHLSSEVKEKSALLYRRILRKNLVRGRSIDAFIAACIYLVCRELEIPRSLKEISIISKRDISDVSRTYRLIIREMKLHMPIDKPEKFIPKTASKLDFSVKIQHRAVEIMNYLRDEHRIVGKDPKGVVAAALYLAGRENNNNRVQEKVAIAAGTTPVTLRKRLKEIRSVLPE